MTFMRDRISWEEGVAAVEFALILPVLALDCVLHRADGRRRR